MNMGIRSFVLQLEMLSVWELLKMKIKRWIITVRVCKRNLQKETISKKARCGFKA